MSEIITRHWSEDPYWTGAARRFYEHREEGAKQLVINLDAIADTLYDGDGPAYRLLEAMLPCRCTSMKAWMDSAELHDLFLHCYRYSVSKAKIPHPRNKY